MKALGRPVAVSGNGNCFFNSLSIALYEDESKAIELRVRTAVELITHMDVYEQMQNKLGIPATVSESIINGISDIITLSREVSAWAFSPAATVIQRSISSVFPPRNGPDDRAYQVLKEDSIAVMWTSVKIERPAYWTPDHFVLLVSGTSQSADDSEDDEQPRTEDRPVS